MKRSVMTLAIAACLALSGQVMADTPHDRLQAVLDDAGLPDHVHLEAFQAEMGARLSGGAPEITPEEAITFILNADADIVLRNVQIVDVASGDIVPDQSVMIRDGMIVDIGHRILAPTAWPFDSGARRADLVLLEANPLDALDTLRHPYAVIAGGRLLDRQALDAMAASLLDAGR